MDSKPVSSVDLALKSLDLLKTLGIVLAVTAIDWFRKKAAMAEAKQAIAETKLVIENKTQEIIQSDSKKSSRSIVDDFIRDERTKGK